MPFTAVAANTTACVDLDRIFRWIEGDLMGVEWKISTKQFFLFLITSPLFPTQPGILQTQMIVHLDRFENDSRSEELIKIYGPKMSATHKISPSLNAQAHMLVGDWLLGHFHGIAIRQTSLQRTYHRSSIFSRDERQIASHFSVMNRLLLLFWINGWMHCVAWHGIKYTLLGKIVQILE